MGVALRTVPSSEMSAREARSCVERINSGIDDIRALILELHERRGWRALGYDNWRSCVTAEFPQSERRMYQELSAAKVERVLNNCSKAPVRLPESHARVLSKLEDAALPKIWAEVQKTAPDGVVTAKHVATVVARFRPAQEPEPFHPLAAFGALKEKLSSTVRSTVESWPAKARSNVPGLLRDLADDFEKEFPC